MIRITSVIPTYNQEQHIDSAIQSVVEQLGNFSHEVLVSSDGSTDRTRDRISDWQRRYPMLIRDVSSDKNVGISGNFRHLFSSASGDYLAILEGDDIWTDPEKLQKQSAFMEDNPECSMVFSMIRVRQLPSGADYFLDRQTNLNTDKLRGEDFLADPSMNLIANFSSCMIKTKLVQKFPDCLFRERFNEIAMAFFLEKFGPIGFLKEEMGIYHQHSNGVWTGMSREAQLRAGLATREMVLEVADARHSGTISAIIEDCYRKPLLALSGKQSSC